MFSLQLNCSRTQMETITTPFSLVNPALTPVFTYSINKTIQGLNVLSSSARKQLHICASGDIFLETQTHLKTFCVLHTSTSCTWWSPLRSGWLCQNNDPMTLFTAASLWCVHVPRWNLDFPVADENFQENKQWYHQWSNEQNGSGSLSQSKAAGYLGRTRASQLRPAF